jgi:DNA-directed RNA polymerase specialized sigma24 family protein
MGVAPKGAFPVAPEKPAISQGASCSYDIDASPIRIERMLRSVFINEEKIAQLEWLSSVKGRPFVKLQGETRPRYVSDVADELKTARAARDSHIAEMQHVIDYALTTDAYEDVRCADCKPWSMPHAPLDFIRVAADAEPPPGSTSMCKTCKGLGTVRSRKMDNVSKAVFKRISYFKRVLEPTSLCAKVRFRTSDKDAAYDTLLEGSARLISKFGNETQTAMERQDAEQGARMGIVDAAMKFDPTRPECAAFGTVAHNWAYRNSRARKHSDERAGVYAASLDDRGPSDDGSSKKDLLTSADGALSSFDEACSSNTALVIDMRNKISALPEDQRRVVLAIYGGDSVATAARALKMKRVEVQELQDAAFATLRDSLSGYVEVVCD